MLPSANVPSWLVVDLGTVQAIDRIALVPARVESSLIDGVGYGFPRRFRIELSPERDFGQPTFVADQSRTRYPNPGPYPYQVEVRGARGRYVRVTSLEHWQGQDRWFWALGEVLVLAGDRNLAVGTAVTSSGATEVPPVWQSANAVDGVTPLGLPLAAEPSPTNGYLTERTPERDSTKWVEVDLGHVVAIDEIRLVAARPTDFADVPGRGFPLRFRVEGSTRADFASPRTIADFTKADVANPGDDWLVIPGAGERARVVRVTAERLGGENGNYLFALAELQVISGGRNIAFGSSVSSLDEFDNPQFPRWDRTYLVDGYSSQRRLLPIDKWIDALEERATLERGVINLGLQLDDMADRAGRIAMASLVAAALLVVAPLTVEVRRQRRARARQAEELRQQLARDLHDEIGSNLAAMGLIGRAARGRTGEELASRLDEIESLVRETADSMRDMVWMLEPAAESLPKLLTRLRQAAARLLVGVEYDFESSDLPAVALSLPLRRGVLLVFKELLHNVVRHAGATRVEIVVACEGRHLRLLVRDNGRGFDLDDTDAGVGLGSIHARVEQLHGRIDIDTRDGTTVTVNWPLVIRPDAGSASDSPT